MTDGFALKLVTLRDYISTRIHENLSGQTGAVAAALLVGDHAGLSEQTNDLLRETGLAHLLAISGLHMGLVAGTIFFLVRAGLAAVLTFALHLPLKKISACIAFTAAFAYLLLAGAPVPTQRAFIMYGIMLGAILLDREPVSLRLVAAAALSVVLLHPFSVLGPSFQMSFVAVVALVSVYEWWSTRRAISGRDRILGGDSVLSSCLTYLFGVIVTSLIVSITTAPIVAYHFQQVPTLGALANVFAIPITAFITMPAGIVALLCVPFGGEAAALWVMGWGIDLTLWLAEFVAGSGLSAFKTAAFGKAGLVLALAGFCWLAIWRRGWRYLGAVPIVAACVLWGSERSPDILVSEDGKLIAANVDQHGQVLSDGTSGKFVRIVWRQRLNVSDERYTFSSVETAPDARSGCDDRGCVLTIKGRSVAFPSSSEALGEDCGRADAVVWPYRAPNFCKPPLFLIDGQVIRRAGGLAIWVGPDGAELLSVNSERGERPWTITSSE